MIFTSVVTGQSIYFGFGFTTLNLNQLYNFPIYLSNAGFPNKEVMIYKVIWLQNETNKICQKLQGSVVIEYNVK